MSNTSQDKGLMAKAWALQFKLEARGKAWLDKMGRGFIVVLFGFSLVGYSAVSFFYFIFIDGKDLEFIINSPDIIFYLNPIMVLFMGFIIILIVYLDARGLLSFN